MKIVKNQRAKMIAAGLQCRHNFIGAVEDFFFEEKLLQLYFFNKNTLIVVNDRTLIRILSSVIKKAKKERLK